MPWKCFFSICIRQNQMTKCFGVKKKKKSTFGIGQHFHSAAEHCLKHCICLCSQCCDCRVKQMTTDVQFNILWWISIDYRFVITGHCTLFSYQITERSKITLYFLLFELDKHKFVRIGFCCNGKNTTLKSNHCQTKSIQLDC